MKASKRCIIWAIALTNMIAFECAAQLIIEGADGTDLEFAPTEDVEIDLSLAAERSWKSASAVAGQGVYDSEKWAVVFKYERVEIPSGVTVTFRNHPSNAPVVWLVQGDVVIEGDLILNGEHGSLRSDVVDPLVPAVPGPGGFRGGVARAGSARPSGAGFGFGGGGRDSNGSSGSFGRTGTGGAVGRTYGTARLFQLVGGSGGSGSSSDTRVRGGAGGGAMLIAAQGAMQFRGGSIHSRGGNASRVNSLERSGGPGSGGAIRLIANVIEGNGLIRVTGGSGPYSRNGGEGRIAIEANSHSGVITTIPGAVSIKPETPPILWPPDDFPDVEVISVAGVPVSDEPLGLLGPPNADVTIDIDSSEEVEILIRTRNLNPAESEVVVKVTPVSGSHEMLTVTEPQSGDANEAIWAVRTTFFKGFAAIQARGVGLAD